MFGPVDGGNLVRELGKDVAEELITKVILRNHLAGKIVPVN
jgi:hypothetical protein